MKESPTITRLACLKLSKTARLLRSRSGQESFLDISLALGLWLLLAFLAIFGGLAHGDDNRGVSWILQMCSEKADCSDVTSAYKEASTVNAGWMYLTSNPNRCKCAPVLLADSRSKRVRVTICNSTCFPERGRHCEPQECFAGMTGATASAAVLKGDKATYRRIDKGIAQAKKDLEGAKGALEVGVSACLECTLSRPARQKLAEYVAAQFPAAKRVDNPMNDSCLSGYLCEKHGSPAGSPGIISDNDGLDYDGIDQRKYWEKNRTSWLALAWKGCNNGLAKGEGYKPGVQRTAWCGASRDGRDFSTATRPTALDVASPISEKDKLGCKRWLKAPDGPQGFVLKLSEGRSYGVLLALGGPFKRVELRKNGKVVDWNGGPRKGVPYLPDPPTKRRRIYDMTQHPHGYPDNSVLYADGTCWVLEKPSFRVD